MSNFEENIPTNIRNQGDFNPSFNMKRNHNEKAAEVLSILKEREQSQKHLPKSSIHNDPYEYEEINDTFTYSIEPESLAGSNIYKR